MSSESGFDPDVSFVIAGTVVVYSNGIDSR